MANLTEIFATTIKVTYTNYSENVNVNEANAQQLRNLINNDSDVQGWEVYTQGDYSFQLVEPTEKVVSVDLEEFRRDGTVKHTYPNCLVSVRKDGKVKFEGDTCGAWSFRFQKVKESSFGEYINVYGKRSYFAGGAPIFNN